MLLPRYFDDHCVSLHTIAPFAVFFSFPTHLSGILFSQRERAAAAAATTTTTAAAAAAALLQWFVGLAQWGVGITHGLASEVKCRTTDGKTMNRIRNICVLVRRIKKIDKRKGSSKLRT